MLQQCEASLNLSRKSWRYKIKWAWIVALFAIFIVSEATSISVAGLWESVTGPLSQWTAILGSIMVSMVHSLDVFHWYKHVDSGAVSRNHYSEFTELEAPLALHAAREDGDPDSCRKQEIGMLPKNTPSNIVVQAPQ